MITFGQNNTKYRPYYFLIDMINIKHFDPNLLDIDKISFKSTGAVIYHTEYITMKSLDNENIDSANRLYLVFNDADGYIECNSIEESNENKYLVFAYTDNNNEVLEKYTELWGEIKTQIETINCGTPIKYKIDFTKVRFESDDHLLLSKMLSIPSMIIVIRYVFQEGNNYYPQVRLYESLY